MAKTERLEPLFPTNAHKTGIVVTLAVILLGSIVAPFFLWLLAPAFLIWVFWLARKRWFPKKP